ncbi:hypothetical protein PMIN01_03199 [Paraphaeosphaeria minitans]|uniref:Uncharacterized protein n=1 Tax=Paraphaeosphaeria minitans TaxID=565426 RepID=A0A9P6GLM5_9PLEO|nr:hypothetical protein PMIN01_03199 [Paraphaeosphaeria minitans]
MNTIPSTFQPRGMRETSTPFQPPHQIDSYLEELPKHSIISSGRLSELMNRYRPGVKEVLYGPDGGVQRTQIVDEDVGISQLNLKRQSEEIDRVAQARGFRLWRRSPVRFEF